MDPLDALADSISRMSAAQIAFGVAALVVFLAGYNAAAYLSLRRRGRGLHQSSPLDALHFDKREWGVLALTLAAALALAWAALRGTA